MLPFCRSCRCHFHGSFRDELGLGSDIHRWCRKIGNVPITHLVTGRDGRSYPGIGSDSCSNDGGCRRFLVARLFPVYVSAAPDVLVGIGYVGAFTSLYAAVVACVQTDIKRVLAFSTISQIGFMMVALGVSGMGGHQGLGYMASMFHLFTHAMFKALLFLCAGAIIHTIGSNEMSRMGGLRKYMPFTHLTFLVACLAISGIPPFPDFSVKTRF